jgi:hypothetical protein
MIQIFVGIHEGALGEIRTIHDMICHKKRLKLKGHSHGDEILFC